MERGNDRIQVGGSRKKKRERWTRGPFILDETLERGKDREINDVLVTKGGKNLWKKKRSKEKRKGAECPEKTLPQRLKKKTGYSVLLPWGKKRRAKSNLKKTRGEEGKKRFGSRTFQSPTALKQGRKRGFRRRFWEKREGNKKQGRVRGP